MTASHPEGTGGSPIGAYLDALHESLAPVTAGAVADYIPQLARADPDTFGIAIATVGGAVYESGDSRAPFTIQSISKPLTFGLVLEDLGEAAVRARIGVEPTGEAFNSITLGPGGAPLNPMVNAGAIAAAGMVQERGGRTAAERVLDLYSAYAGRALRVDEDTARSESETGHRNRAIAHLLSAAGAIEGDPTEVVERYFRQCSIALDCRDAAVVAGTLANDGVNPLTGERVARASTVRSVLVVMATCGMYDGAGEWLYTVGLPAKSGVSGTVLAVLPGALGIAVHSPPLDDKGNSVRGVRACRRLSRDLDLHLVAPGSRQLPVHAAFTLADAHSKRVRGEEEYATLTELGQRAVVLELQGELSFPAVEIVVREVLNRRAGMELAVLDLRRVDVVRDAAARLLAGLAAELATSGARLILSGTRRHEGAIRHIARRAGGDTTRVRTFHDLGDALEWCEDRLLAAAGALREPRRIALRRHALLAGLADRDVARIRRLLARERYPAGTEIVRPGDPGDRIHLITRGRLTALVSGADGTPRTVATLVPGMLFGELAFLDRRAHSGLVRADTEVECYVLGRAELDGLQAVDPTAQVTLLVNLARMLAGRADAMRAELAVRDAL
jgi:glutaminase